MAAAAAVMTATPVFEALAQTGDVGSTQHRGPIMQQGAPGTMGPGMMNSDMMDQRMMDGHMMGGSMGGHHMGRHHMMGGHFGRNHGGGNEFARRVTPAVHLTEADVRHYFEHRLQRRGNARLKVGEVKQKDDDTIVVDIVTAKESALVDRLQVDRHTGHINRVN
jgi:hypothetical protein